MVLPLLGLGALAVGSLAMPHMQNYANKTRGRATSRALEGVDQSDPMAMNQAMLGAGLIQPQDFMGNQNQQQQFGLAQDRFGLAQRAQAFQEAQWNFGLKQNADQTQNEIDYLRSQGYGNETMLAIPSMRTHLMQQSTAKPDYGQQSYGGGIGAIRSAIGNVETGWLGGPEARWAALGPVIEGGRYAGERAIGPMQVMPGNVAQWGKAAGIPEQWQNAQALQLGVAQGNPEARAAYDAMVDHQLENFQRAGLSDQEIAVAWHSGMGGVNRMRNGGGSPTDRATGINTFGPGGEGASYVDRFNNVLGAGQQQQAQQQQWDLAGVTAADEYAPGINAAQTILDGMSQVARSPDLMQGAEGGVLRDEMARSSQELNLAWQKKVYGDAEPPPRIQKQFEELSRDPNAWFGNNRERTMRFYRLREAELLKAQKYDQLKARAELGDPESLRGLAQMGGRELSREERSRITSGEDMPGQQGAPAEFQAAADEIATGRAPDVPQGPWRVGGPQ